LPVSSPNMAKTLSKPFPKLPRLKQKTWDHCGPAVLSMLAGFLGTKIAQDRFVEAAGVRRKLKKHGMNILELGLAVTKLLPQYRFWYKANATVADLDRIINHYHQPVGVEWQGDFGKYSDGDDGHYSIITRVNLKTKSLQLADPFSAFAGNDRTFTIPNFVSRWWDYNEIAHPKTKRKHKVKDHHMTFTLTVGSRKFPRILKMRQVKEDK